MKLLPLLLLALAVHCKADETKKKDSFKYSDKKTVYAVLKTTASITVNYTISVTQNTTDTKTASVTLDPNNSTVDGSPGNDSIQMNISYPRNSESPLEWTLKFEKKDGKISVTESVLNFGIDDQSPFQFDSRAVDLGTTATVNLDMSLVKWSEGLSWACESEQTTKGDVISSNQTDLEVSMSTKDTQLAAFNHTFAPKADRCNADLKPGNWSVKDPDHNDTDCVKLDAEISLDVYYYNETNGLVGPVNVIVPKTATASGSCNESGDQTMTLTWKKDKKYDWELSLWFSDRQVFTAKTDGAAYTDYRVKLTAHIAGDDQFKDRKASETILVYSNEVNRTSGEGAVSVMGASKEHSVKCKKYEVAIKPDNDTVLKVTINDVHAQAFVYSNDFLSYETCPADQSDSTSDLIPIIVGACLAALVVIVLVAYLIGRARARRTGYESV